MANIDYDANYEWLCEKAKIRQRLAQEWLRETIAAEDADELYIPIGDDLTPLLLSVGRQFAGFEEALAEALDSEYYKEIDDYMEAITDWEEEWGLA